MLMTQCFVPTMRMGFIIIRNYYEMFYSFHPSMFVFLDNKMKLKATIYIYTCIYNSSKHQPNNVRSVNLLSQFFCSSLAGIRTHATKISWHQIACTVVVPLDYVYIKLGSTHAAAVRGRYVSEKATFVVQISGSNPNKGVRK